MTLHRCNQCASFVVGSRCPHCQSASLRASKLGALATVFGSGAIAMTLMACYGCPDAECGRPYDPDAGLGYDGGAAVDDPGPGLPADAGLDAADASRDAAADSDASRDAAADSDADGNTAR